MTLLTHYLHYLHFLTVTYKYRRLCKKVSLTPPSQPEILLTYLHSNLHRQAFSSATLEYSCEAVAHWRAGRHTQTSA